MAQTLSRLQILLHADTANFRREMTNARNEVTGFAKFTEKAGSVMSTFGKVGAVAFAGVSAAAGFLTSQIVPVQREFDVLNAQLVTATGGTQQAAAAFKELQAFAKKTPYDLAQSVEGFAKLKNLGLEPSIASLTSFGNTAAAMGKDLNDMVEAVADASTGEFERLKEFGIKASKQGEEVAFTFQGVTTKVGNNSKEIQDYLLKIGNTNFAGAMDARANTLDGAISSIEDSWKGLLLTISQGGIGDQLKNVVQSAGNALDTLNQKLQQPETVQAFKTAIDGVATAFSAIGSVIGGVVSGLSSVASFVNQNKEAFIALGAAVAGAAVAFGAIQAGIAIFGIFASGTATITLLSGAFTALTAVIGGLGAVFTVLTSPITLTIAAIAALTAAGVYLYRNWDEVKAKATAIFNALPQPVQQMAANIKSILTGLVSFFTTVFNAVKPIAQAGFAFFVTAATAQFNILKSVVTTAWAVIKGLFTANLAAIKAVLTAGVSVFATVFNTGFNLVKNVVTTVFSVIKAVVNGDMQGVKNAISNGINNSISIVRNGANAIVGAFKTLGSQMMQIGADVINGLINGIKNRATALISYVQSLGSQVNSTFRRVFDTHSPSKVTTEIGEFVGDGLIVGLQNRSDAVTNQAAAMANGIIEQTDSVKKAIADLQAKPDELAKAYADIKNSHESGIKGIERQYQERANVISAANVDKAEKEVVIMFEKKQMMEDLAHLYVQQSEEGSKYYEALESYQDVALRKYDNERILIQNNARWTQQAKDYALKAIDEIQKRDIGGYELSQQKKLDDLMAFNDTALQAIDKRYAYERIEVDLMQGATAEYKQQMLDALAAKQQYEREQVQKTAATDFNKLNAEMSGTSELLNLQNQLDQRLEIIKKAKDAEVIATEQAEQAKAKIEYQYQVSRYDSMMASGQQILGSVTGALKATLGEHNKAYRVMFAVEKGVNIARSLMAIDTGIAMAAANPFPMNLGAMASVASATASIVGDIMSLKNPIGQAHDGIMRVPESGTWNLKKNERVLPEHTASRLDRTLDDINAKPKNNSNMPINVIFENHSSASISQVPSQNDNELRFIIRDEMDSHFSSEMTNANSPISKAISNNTTATRSYR